MAYIEQESLLKRIKASPLIANFLILRGSKTLIDGILDLIEKHPIVDAVEVVRCKDCKHCDQFYPNKKIGEEPELVYFCKIEHHATGADDFCSCGKKKKNLSLKDKQRIIDKVTKK